MRPITEYEIAAGLDAMLAGNAPIRVTSNNETKIETAPEPRDWLRVSSTYSGELTMLEIMVAVSRATNVSVTEMKSPRRWKRAARARHIYFALCRQLTSRTLPMIGRSCGDRDHTTIMHGISKVQTHRANYEPEYSKLLLLFHKLKAGELHE